MLYATLQHYPETTQSTGTISGSWLGRLPLCDERSAYAIALAAAVFAVLFEAIQFYVHGLDVTQWDMLLISGVLAFAYGLQVVRRIPKKFEDTLDRLTNRGVVTLHESARTELKREFRNKADLWARMMGLLTAVAMLLAFVWSLSQEFAWPKALLTIPEVLGAYVGGNYLGRMAFYGQLGRILSQTNIEIQVVPGHVDGTAGLKPVGDFFFNQAMIVAIPAVFLSVWLLLFPYWTDYADWQGPYVGLTMIAIPLEVLAFLLPIWSFHSIMVAKKSEFVTLADELTVEINRSKEALINNAGAEKEKDVSDKVEAMQRQFWDIENMPTWPVDLKTRRQFSVNNFLIFLPLLVELLRIDNTLAQLLIQILESVRNSGVVA